MMFTRLCIGAFVVSSAFALAIPSNFQLSSTCQALFSSTDFASASQCLNIDGLSAFSKLSSSDSLVPPIDSYISGLCQVQSTTKCSNATIENFASKISSECGDDLTSLGIPTTILNNLVTYIPKYFEIAIETVCLKDTDASSNWDYCIPSELSIVQSALGSNLSLSTLQQSFTPFISNTTLQKELACTSCVKSMYGVIRPVIEEFSESAVEEVDDSLNGLCGSGFV